MTSAIITEETKMANISFRNGYWFYFPLEECQIAVWGSTWSGKEVVYVNDDPVSESRNLSTQSEHTFTLNGRQYVVTFDVVSILRGEIKCSVTRDGKLVGEESKAYVSKGGKGLLDFFKTFLMFFIGGFAVGAMGAVIASYLF